MIFNFDNEYPAKIRKESSLHYLLNWKPVTLEHGRLGRDSTQISRIARLENHGVVRNAAVGPINHGVPAPSNGLPRGGRRLLHRTSTALPSISVKLLTRISSAIFIS
ncbi:hypothetical protein ACN38_g8689 [Penicillium nordicum]|uniref:Uncharacterized protein n=1 Tax=Penicillium nordicum TaxID=229535 RepID=A0A0M8P4E5_9EURO|nr:hypothetical protein ACN38_g8689 [Penicillium nordicum]